ncbi:MAG: cobalamin B12-binding domain-containing protein [Planctomycetota bacterium]|nr:MAG: cobalamin B12-binding domain-containing protein [Planctomycetota bacterium]
MRRRPLQRQYLLMPFFLVLGVPLTASCQEAPAPAVQSAAAYEATCRSFPACCRDHVYIFLVNGLDPINFGRLLGLRDYVRKLGFRQTYYGQMFHAAYFKKEIRRIHQEDAEAHFVFIGFSAGMNVAHSMAAAVNREGISIDALVYLSGNNPITPMPNDRPGNVRHVLNILASGLMGKTGERDYAENIRLPDAWHFDSPTHPRTKELLAKELMEIGSAIPVPKPEEESMPRAAFAEPTPRPVNQARSQKHDDWDFLKPVSRLKSPLKKESEPAPTPSARQIDYRPGE